MEIEDGPICVISPHLDDGVLGCGDLLASRRGSTVVTVMAGVPDSYETLTAWDAACGFRAGQDVVAARRQEDAMALARVHATPVWLDYLDAQYGEPACMHDIAVDLERVVVDSGCATVLMPMGLFHSDHSLVHEAALLVMRRLPHLRWLAYEEPSYRDVPRALDARLYRLGQQGITATPAEMPAHVEAHALKAGAVEAYASQLSALRAANEASYCTILQPERFWDLTGRGFESRVTAVVLTYNRCDELLTTLAHLTSLRSRFDVIVVDNASQDGTREAVRESFPTVQYIYSKQNLGAAARNLGIQAAATPYVALCDDDTWWDEGSLSNGADLLDAHGRLAAITARVLVGRNDRPDATCEDMADSPLKGAPCLPGRSILGFLAGASLIRREAFLQVGGFRREFFLGGEEELLALDLESAGWQLAYVETLTVHHHPSAIRDVGGRTELLLRNALWTAWLRRPLREVAVSTLHLVSRAVRDRAAGRAFVSALKGLPWVVSERHQLPGAVEARVRQLEATKAA
jgi:GT2 family glycosyltransferase/LmbE family N-acetylglucosaminyl deacetylase